MPDHDAPEPRGDWREGLPPSVDRAALPPVGAIRFDSREVEPGDCFVCIPGARVDGHEYAAQAVERGAVVLVVAEDRAESLRALGVPLAAVPDPRATLAAVAAAHEGYPGRSLTVIGITGTDGKSTTAFLTAAALEGCGLKVGLLTTIESRIAGERLANPTRLTSQEATHVQSMLARMLEAGCTHAVVEATSIGLEWHRLDHCYFDVGVFTNISPDHLDFHETFEAYLRSKTRLFEMLNDQPHGAPQRYAVLNADDPRSDHIAARTKARVVTYGLDAPDPDVRVDDLMLWPDGATFTLATEDDEIEASIRLPGRYNVANAAAAATVAGVLGLDIYGAVAGIASCEGVPGRMEAIPGAPFEVIVDYAHTADAMRNVAETLRPVVQGRLIAVFGCAGERALDRRSGLGRVAAERLDYAILTDEDPRSEPSDAIIEDIARAMREAGAVEGERFERVPDRRAAIARALEIAQPGDLVLIAGKGHESTIEYADGPRPWDDRQVARELIAERFGHQGKQ